MCQLPNHIVQNCPFTLEISSLQGKWVNHTRKLEEHVHCACAKGYIWQQILLHITFFRMTWSWHNSVTFGWIWKQMRGLQQESSFFSQASGPSRSHRRSFLWWDCLSSRHKRTTFWHEGTRKVLISKSTRVPWTAAFHLSPCSSLK